MANPGQTQSDYITTTLLTDLINTDEASLNVWGAYGMFNFRKNERFSGNAGARLEVADMFIRSRKIDLVNDLTDAQIANLQGGLNEVDLMPSFNFTYALGELDPIKLTNLRMSYSRTIARPVFREKAPFRSFNFEWLEVLKNNPELDETKIDNFDLRLEHFPDWVKSFRQVFSTSDSQTPSSKRRCWLRSTLSTRGQTFPLRTFGASSWKVAKNLARCPLLLQDSAFQETSRSFVQRRASGKMNCRPSAPAIRCIQKPVLCLAKAHTSSTPC